MQKHRLKTANLLCVTPQKSDDLIYTKKKPDIAHAIFIPQAVSNCELGFQSSTHVMEHGRLNRTLINKKLHIYMYSVDPKVSSPCKQRDIVLCHEQAESIHILTSFFNHIKKNYPSINLDSSRVLQEVEALRYKPEGRGFDSQ